VEHATWRKSSYSDGDGDETNCVEVAFGKNMVGVRDSKAPEIAPLTFPSSAWRTFLSGVRGTVVH
jgi:hypothetical protein